LSPLGCIALTVFYRIASARARAPAVGIIIFAKWRKIAKEFCQSPGQAGCNMLFQ
jgi:hypothetical protein